MAALFEELQVLKAAETLADNIWYEVSQWEGFTRDTVGKQFTRAADSIGANINDADLFTPEEIAYLQNL